MRRKVVFSLAAIFLLLVLLILGYQHLASEGNAGYVIIGIGSWVLETSLYVVIVGVLLSFLLINLAIRLANTAAKLPSAMKRKNSVQRVKKSQEALVAGLIETAEGNWEKAERNLIRHAADSGTPLVNYLIAARAAHARGANELREEYLTLAHRSAPEAEMAIALTRAELQLSSRQFEEALETLTTVNQMAPTHAGVLRLLHQAYVQTENWEALHRLMPHLRNTKVMLEAEVKLLELSTYTELLKEKAKTRDAAAIREIWRHVPIHIRDMPGVVAIYAAAMIDAGAGGEVEEEVRLSLGKDWNETLLVLYGCLQTQDPVKHFQSAQAWLAPHPEDAVLLRVLSKLSLRTGSYLEAQDYAQRSLRQLESLEAYRLLGEIHHAKGDYVQASQFYKKGLMLASDHIVEDFESEAPADSLESAQFTSPVIDSERESPDTE